jgi:hypothetical protein
MARSDAMRDLTKREQARRDELKAIEQAGRDAEAELRAIDAEIEKADAALEAHPTMIATRRVIAEHHLNAAAADAVIRGQKAALFGSLLAQQRDQDARAKRSAVDASIAEGEPDAERS